MYKITNLQQKSYLKEKRKEKIEWSFVSSVVESAYFMKS